MRSKVLLLRPGKSWEHGAVEVHNAVACCRHKLHCSRLWLKILHGRCHISKAWPKRKVLGQEHPHEFPSYCPNKDIWWVMRSWERNLRRVCDAAISTPLSESCSMYEHSCGQDKDTYKYHYMRYLHTIHSVHTHTHTCYTIQYTKICLTCHRSIHPFIHPSFIPSPAHTYG